MGTENSQTNPRAASSRPAYGANDPYAAQTGLRGGLVQGLGQVKASGIGKNIDQFTSDQQTTQGRIAERRQSRTALRSDFETQQNAARATGTAPVFRPGQQIFK